MIAAESGNAPAVAAGEPTLAPDTRVASVDTLRGLVILLMIFVNDLGRAPHWLKHASSRADEMTLPDIVFPGFLFIAGVSIPLAIWHARLRQTHNWKIFGKILVRTFGLLVMGVLMVNQEEHDYSLIAGVRWGLLAYLAMLLAFPVVPRKPDKRRPIFMAIKIFGVIALIVVTLIYRNEDGRRIVLGPLFDSTDNTWLRHSWWGILGLIAWAYLMASLVYLIAGRRREWLIGAVFLLMCMYVMDRAKGGLFARYDPIEGRHWFWLEPIRPLLQFLAGIYHWMGNHVSWGQTLGTGAAITTAGCCLGSILLPDSDVKSPGQRLRWGFGFALLLFVGGLILDPPYGINKIGATPAWSLYCAALTTLVWVFLYWLMDLKGWRGWAAVVAPAGATPLLAYLLHPLVIAFLPPAVRQVFPQTIRDAAWYQSHALQWALLLGLPVAFFMLARTREKLRLLIGGCSAVLAFYTFLVSPQFYKSDDYENMWIGIFGSLCMAFLVVGLTGMISRLGYRMRA